MCLEMDSSMHFAIHGPIHGNELIRQKLVTILIWFTNHSMSAKPNKLQRILCTIYADIIDVIRFFMFKIIYLQSISIILNYEYMYVCCVCAICLSMLFICTSFNCIFLFLNWICYCS